MMVMVVPWETMLTLSGGSGGGGSGNGSPGHALPQLPRHLHLTPVKAQQVIAE